MNLTCPIGVLLLCTFHAADESPAKPRHCPAKTAQVETPTEETTTPVLTFDRARVRPPEPAQGQPLARVFAEYISPADLKAESPILTKEQSDQLSGRILTPLFQKFAEERQLGATEEEIAQFQTAIRKVKQMAMQLGAIKDAAGEELTPEEQREFDAAMRGVAETFIIGWKTDRALYERYGGVVIFQQANPSEPVGAYRKFLEEAEKLGAFEIYDPANREKFWHYFVRKHPFESPADKIDFSQPWWAKINNASPPVP